MCSFIIVPCDVFVLCDVHATPVIPVVRIFPLPLPSMDHFSALPPQLRLLVLEFLPSSDLIATAKVDRATRLLSADEVLWKRIYHLKFGSTPKPVACWRAECFNKKKEVEYTKALTYGRLGRVCPAMMQPVTSKISYLDARDEAAPVVALASSTEAPPVRETEVEQTRVAAVVARQGTATWSALSR